MRIDPKGTIADHPALMVRDCLRKLKAHPSWDLRDLEAAASLKPGDGRMLLRALSTDGLIEEAEPGTWAVTQAGQIEFTQGILNVPGNGFNELNGPYDAKVVGDYFGLTPP